MGLANDLISQITAKRQIELSLYGDENSEHDGDQVRQSNPGEPPYSR